MIIEDKVIKLEKESIMELAELMIDGNRDKAYEFAKKLKEYIEKQEENYKFHRNLSGFN